MAELAAEAARLLRVREKDILSLRLLRRSVDAREEVRLVYTVEVVVKEESAALRRARSRKISRAAQAPAYAPPSPLPAPAVPPVVVGAKNWITPPYEFDEFFFPQAEWIVDAVNAKIVPLNGYVSKITPTEAQFLKNAKAGV